MSMTNCALCSKASLAVRQELKAQLI